MELNRRNLMVYTLLAAVWALVAAWQVEEHVRARAGARTNLSHRSKDIANTISACIRGMRFRGTVLQERLEPVLNELISGSTNELVKSSHLLSIALLNAEGEPVASAGRPVDFSQAELLRQGERWGAHSVVFVNPVDLGASLSSEGRTNPTVVLPPFRPPANKPPEPPPDRPPPARAGGAADGLAGGPADEPEPRPREEPRSRRPPWLRGLSESDYQSLMQKRALHGLVLSLSTEPLQATLTQDLWVRAIILLLAAVAAFGSAVAWRNLATSSELQIRLIRASELNTHLKEMNLAAAGLAHETRNPLNIIRGLAQMISKRPEAAPEIRQQLLEIVGEADKVAAQLNEFINYSRPREVRLSALSLNSVVNDVVRALSYDLEEKKIQLQVKGETIAVEADEQLLRQALFNLLLNAVQAVDGAGRIEVVAERQGATEASIEVRDNGPGVPAERRDEVFKPYFTTHKTGTGLGLAVVQQIVLAHGWEIRCLPHQPNGAVFRITHLKVA